MEKLLKPKNQKETELLLLAFKCILDSKDAIYISGPITTGDRHLDWHIKNRQNSSEFRNNQLHRQEVIENNIKNIELIAKSIRKISDSIVIEPASLELKHWIQDDYLLLWGRVIEKYVKNIVFVTNWEYSRGCVYEFYLGLINQIGLLDANMSPINIPIAINRIKNTIMLFKNHSLDVSLQEKLFILMNETYRNIE